MLENRIYNFSAGPSMLPEPVLVRAKEEMLNYEGSGMSVMEMSHRSKVYDKIICDCQENLRKVMNIPDNYKVLFLQGGASGMFAAIPLNLAKTGTADYIVTGNFSGGAFKEGKKYLKDARCAGTTESENFTRIPKQDELTLNPDADYVHICENNTIFGTKWHWLPDTGSVPRVADLSSCILSEPVDVSRYGMIYGGAQKNMAPAGFAVVIVREDLLGNKSGMCPKIWDFATQADKNSMINTPPTYSIYICKLVLDWIMNDIGGLENMKKRNEEKAAMLYDYLETTDFYKSGVQKDSRSMMNVTFRTGDDEMDKKFIAGSIERGFTNLKGHRLVGGMRTSIYNAMPKEGVEALIDFMKEFEKANS
ncbi:MAG: 3-phosphoserine/phosphohydroxythreonine transaminase [Lachnospiraceae bacterium]|nr:3-phosphoserine/phosphohydroxythreonine transaminase [Lachnospiraceae bacterium]